MLIPRFVLSILSIGIVVLGASVASGQDYPNRPIRIVTASVGGGADYASRLIAPGISGPLGQAVIVDNRATALVGELVSKSPPDGYTLLVTGSFLWMTPLLRESAYDPVRDFSPISVMTSSPNMLVVHPSLPVKSVKELIALAKAKPGELNYSSGVSGGPTHLAAELFKYLAGVNIVRIPYRDTAISTPALIAGEVQMTFEAANIMTPHVKAGKLRALAVTTAQPSALAPGLPTMAASGVPGYESVSRFGIFAPAKTPEAIINRLNQEIVRVLNRADAKEKLFTVGAEVVGSTPEQFSTAIKSEMATMGKVIKDAGIKAD